MADVGFGALGQNAFGDNYAWTGGIGLPTGQVMANGSVAVLIVALFGYTSGRGAARTVENMSLGSSGTGAFTIAAGSNGSVGTGWRSSGAWLVSGGSATFTIDVIGSCWFGHGGGGSMNVNGTTLSGAMAGAYRYVQAPTAPQALTMATAPGGKANLTWAAPASNGETAIEGYTVRYATNSGMTGATTVDAGNALSLALTGLTAGQTYWVDVAARNAVTTAAGTVGIRTATVSALVLSGGKVRVGGTWKSAVTKVRVGGVWKDAIVKVRVGGVWKDAQ